MADSGVTVWEIFTSLGTLGAAGLAAYSTWLAKRSSETARDSVIYTQEQARIAELSRKQMLRPVVVIYADTPSGQPGNVHLIIENLGSGTALDVECKLLEGSDFVYEGANPISTWTPFERGISVLPVGRKLDTLLVIVSRDLERQVKDQALLRKRVSVRIDYKDIEGTSYTQTFSEINLKPHEGRRWTEPVRTINGKIV
ncbi:hypothetical protein ACFFLM_19180 [Deinococcus oregonensis]|uniref:Uncharacterized protein n=1 Tax=Deinococcus oregonensis TaxID=1805970 RepID=A0ABV6B573_9DEIO